MPQAHHWFTDIEVRREPTNEELNLMANLAVSYGVRGMQYFMFSSIPDVLNPCRIEIGIANDNDPNGGLIAINNYGQTNPTKKETFQGIVNRLSNKWSPYLLSFNNADRHSYIYDFASERSSLINNSYFYDFAL